MIRDRHMKYYGIYKITNLVNGKMYIGQHVTDNLDDGYMGSGKLIKRALSKYGVENFRKEWLGFYEDEEELNYMERVFVDETWVSRSDTYNLKIGGEGGWSYINKHNLYNRIGMKGKHLAKETKQKISEATKGKNKGKTPWNKGKTNVYSQETLQKWSTSHSNHKHTVETKAKISAKVRGKNNPMYGKSAWKGKHHSEETKRKMSESRKQYWQSKRNSK